MTDTDDGAILVDRGDYFELRARYAQLAEAQARAAAAAAAAKLEVAECTRVAKAKLRDVLGDRYAPDDIWAFDDDRHALIPRAPGQAT